MNDRARQQIAAGLGTEVRSATALHGGCVAEVWALQLADGRRVVAKVDGGTSPKLALEGRMLGDLAAHLPVPEVLLSEPELLVMGFVPGRTSCSAQAEEHAADLLACLHDVTWEGYGFDYDTVIGGLHQPNPRTESWIDFFREQRLLFMAKEAHRAGRLPAASLRKVDRVAADLERWLPSPQRPGLIHGDVWSGNVLAEGERITAFLDPAIHFADPEIELAFITLFHCFGPRFFDRYAEHRPIAPGFFEERRDLYNLYPLLVHVRLFGGSYVGDVERILRRFGG